jgi:hypothetical protein
MCPFIAAYDSAVIAVFHEYINERDTTVKHFLFRDMTPFFLSEIF